MLVSEILEKVGREGDIQLKQVPEEQRRHVSSGPLTIDNNHSFDAKL